MFDVPLQLPDLAALATAEANGFMGMQHALQYGQLQLPPDFATANALGVNVPVALDPSQRHSQEQLAHQMDGRASHPGQHVCPSAGPSQGLRSLPPLCARSLCPARRFFWSCKASANYEEPANVSTCADGPC